MRQNHKNTLFQLYIITTNRPSGAVGVEEINGLVRNANGLCTNAKWFAIRMRMLHQGDISINHKYG